MEALAMTNENRSTIPAVPAIPESLTAEQRTTALALFARLLEYRRSGVRMVQVTLPRQDEPLRVAPIGRRIEIG
jgi:hypothetical protein